VEVEAGLTATKTFSVFGRVITTNGAARQGAWGLGKGVAMNYALDGNFGGAHLVKKHFGDKGATIYGYTGLVLGAALVGHGIYYASSTRHTTELPWEKPIEPEDPVPPPPEPEGRQVPATEGCPSCAGAPQFEEVTVRLVEEEPPAPAEYPVYTVGEDGQPAVLATIKSSQGFLRTEALDGPVLEPHESPWFTQETAERFGLEGDHDALFLFHAREWEDGDLQESLWATPSESSAWRGTTAGDLMARYPDGRFIRDPGMNGEAVVFARPRPVAEPPETTSASSAADDAPLVRYDKDTYDGRDYYARYDLAKTGNSREEMVDHVRAHQARIAKGVEARYGAIIPDELESLRFRELQREGRAPDGKAQDASLPTLDGHGDSSVAEGSAWARNENMKLGEPSPAELPSYGDECTTCRDATPPTASEALASPVEGATDTPGFRTLQGPLFGPNGPRPSDVGQGYFGDCYLMASMQAIAKQHPEMIVDMIRPNEDGTFTVRLHAPGGWVLNRKGKTIWRDPHSVRVTVSPEVPDFAARSLEGSWPAIVEKAYAEELGRYQAERSGYAGENGYQGIGHGGYAVDVLERLTGWKAEDFGSNEADSNFEWLQQQHDGGALIAAASLETPPAPFDRDFVAHHVYAVTNVYRAPDGTQMISLFNPHNLGGNYGGEFSMPTSDFAKAYHRFTVAANPHR
jgi:hypothetical protein